MTLDPRYVRITLGAHGRSTLETLLRHGCLGSEDKAYDMKYTDSTARSCLPPTASASQVKALSHTIEGWLRLWRSDPRQGFLPIGCRARPIFTPCPRRAVGYTITRLYETYLRCDHFRPRDTITGSQRRFPYYRSNTSNKYDILYQIHLLVSRGSQGSFPSPQNAHRFGTGVVGTVSLVSRFELKCRTSH